jgi:hypothetical protein
MMLARSAWLALGLLAGCASSPRMAHDDPRDEAVLAAVLDGLCDQGDAGYYFVLDRSVGVESDTAEGVEASAMRSLAERNETPGRLDIAKRCPRLRIASEKEIGDATRRGDWDRFHRAFPQAKGILYLSRPGYSSDGRTAVVDVGSGCGSLCGAGFLWVLKADAAGHWTVERMIPTWVS